MMNEAKGVERVKLIIDKKTYFYEKCIHRVIENVKKDPHANVTRVQPVRSERLIRGDSEQNGSDHKTNKRLEENSAKHGDQFRSVTGIKDSNEKSDGVNHVIECTVERESQLKAAVKEEVHEGNCNELREKNSTEKMEEKDTEDDTSTEVEVLDSDEIIKQGISSAFVPSTIYRSDFGVSKASSNYRGRVLNVLKKPFDKEEYRTLSEGVKCYLAKYRGLKKKLKQHRYNRATRLTILRGFFYWLKNVVHDEAFQPWEDSECLAVQPGSGLEN